VQIREGGVAKNILTPEEGEELKRLYLEHSNNTARAGALLAAHGMDSVEFAEADKLSTQTWGRIREILGTSGLHWMAS
jgi:hypothetical protein